MKLKYEIEQEEDGEILFETTKTAMFGEINAAEVIKSLLYPNLSSDDDDLHRLREE